MPNIFDASSEYKSLAQEARQGGYNGEQIDIGFSGMFSLGSESTYSRSTLYGRASYEQDAYSERNKKIESSGLAEEYGIDTSSISSVGHIYAKKGKGALSKYYRKNFDDQEEKINKLREDHPNLGIKSREEIQNEILERHKNNVREESKARDNASLSGKAAFFAGNIVGFLKDPLNLASMTVPYGVVGGSVGKALVKIFSMEAAIGGTLDAIQKPGEVELRRELGEDISDVDALKEIAITAASSGVFGVVIGGIGMSVMKAITGRVTKREQAKIDEAYKEALQEQEFQRGASETTLQDDLAKKDIKDILQEGEQIARRKPPYADQQKHVAAYQKAAQDIEEGRLPEVDEIVGKKSIIDDPVDISSAPEDSRLLDTEKSEDLIRNTQIDEIRARLTEEDVQLKSIDAEGNEVATSARAMLDEMSADKKAIEDVITCMRKGGPNGS